MKKLKPIYLLVVFILIIIYKKFMNTSKYFSMSEFQSKDGEKMPLGVCTNVVELIKNMDVLREYIGKPIIINSGYRSVKHNESVGGVKNSFHTVGKACDFHVKGMTTLELKTIIEKLINDGKMSQGGLGYYPTWVHYDIRGTKARWNG